MEYLDYPPVSHDELHELLWFLTYGAPIERVEREEEAPAPHARAGGTQHPVSQPSPFPLTPTSPTSARSDRSNHSHAPTQGYYQNDPRDHYRNRPDEAQTSPSPHDPSRQARDSLADRGANGQRNESSFSERHERSERTERTERDPTPQPQALSPPYVSSQERPTSRPERPVEYASPQGGMTPAARSQSAFDTVPTPQGTPIASPERQISPEIMPRTRIDSGGESSSLSYPGRDAIVSERNITYDEHYQHVARRTVEDNPQNTNGSSWDVPNGDEYEGEAPSDLGRRWSVDSNSYDSWTPQQPSPSPASPATSPHMLHKARKHPEVVDQYRGNDTKKVKPRHELGVTKMVKGKTLLLPRGDDARISESICRDRRELDASMFLLHSRSYLDPVTESNPLANIRLVFAAHQLPRGAEFADLVGPLRRDCMIDTYMIPHESVRVREDHDIILGFSGTLERVCDALWALLRQMAPKVSGFMLWRLCLLVPTRCIGYFMGSNETKQYDDLEDRRYSRVESSVPCLRKAMGCTYGPLPGARQECLISIESCSLETIMEAVFFIGDGLTKNEDPYESCHGYYKGGAISVIPRHVQLPWNLRDMASRVDRRVPAGYIMRPEMHGCLRVMQNKRYHLQFLLTIEQACGLAGESGAVFRAFHLPKEATVSISDQLLLLNDDDNVPVRLSSSRKEAVSSENEVVSPKDEDVPSRNHASSSSMNGLVSPKVEFIAPKTDTLSSKDEIRICDIGANELSIVERAVVEIVNWMVVTGLGKSSVVAIYTPERAVARFGSFTTGCFQHSVLSMFDVEQQVRSVTTRLEPAEKEFILRINSRDTVGIQHGVNAILTCIYKED